MSSAPDPVVELSASARRVFETLAQLGATVRVFRRSFVFYAPQEAYRRSLMGPLQTAETRVEQGRRHRQLKWINARNRRSTP